MDQDERAEYMRRHEDDATERRRSEVLNALTAHFGVPEATATMTTWVSVNVDVGRSRSDPSVGLLAGFPSHTAIAFPEGQHPSASITVVGWRPEDVIRVEVTGDLWHLVFANGYVNFSVETDEGRRIATTAHKFQSR